LCRHGALLNARHFAEDEALALTWRPSRASSLQMALKMQKTKRSRSVRKHQFGTPPTTAAKQIKDQVRSEDL